MSRAKEDAWFKYMNRLRRHMLSCSDCRGAIDAFSVHRMCLTGSRLVVSAAAEFNAVLDIKKRAHASADGFVYACPDISLHGECAALSAQPLKVIGIQGELF